MANYYQYPPSVQTTAYLLGLGPMPGPTPQERAVAQMNAALDSGMFDQTQQPRGQNFGGGVIDPALLAQSGNNYAAVPNITVEFPVYGENNQKTPSLKTQIVFPIDIPATDFFSRVYAKMNVDPTTAVLGWKESQDRRGDPYQSLTSSDDLANAFGRLVKIQNNTRRKKEVIMEVVNLEQRSSETTTKKKADKPSETAVTLPELRKVKEKLTCALHPGKNRWCYVRGPKDKRPGEHVPLDLEVLLLWARHMHDGKVDENCITPPNVLNLDELAERGRAREERTGQRRGQALPPIHVHVGGNGPLRDVDPNVVAPSHKRHRVEESSDSESDSDDEPLTIADVLQKLHAKFPDLKYPQYSDALKAKGIIYAHSALDFDVAYFKAEIGMADGAVGGFIKCAKKMVRAAKKQKKGNKRARQDAEGSDGGKENA
ncbi:hypothetical protein C8F04DRAFT_1324746 [Mycena alexandri]|uniref:Uncharacterized protein n=1 Tax=Mycena alexandri TaxID=1745969 RepID=A0AAD6S1W5_9AGAR|nr:hypothetical protein C8F04DRAFT_1324746 [Mycena alexandri]